MIKKVRTRTALLAFASILATALLATCGGAYDDADADAEAAADAENGYADADADADMEDADGMDGAADMDAGAEADAGAMALTDANDASAEALSAALEAIPGAAEAIMAARPFANPSELHAALAEAVGDEAARQAYATVWVPLDLNSAVRDEILLIPGLGDRMAHEFEEYRPYADMDQFRREMGKYVDEEEVARLERYVTIK